MKATSSTLKDIARLLCQNKAAKGGSLATMMMTHRPTTKNDGNIHHNTTMDTAWRLNEVGTTLARNDRPLEAVPHFFDAFCTLSSTSCDKTNDNMPTSTHWSYLDEQPTSSPPPHKRRRTAMNDSTQHRFITPITKASTFTKQPPPQGGAAAPAGYPTSEYDEGMNIFSPCLSINADNDSVHCAQATILLNLGLVHVALGQGEVACTCFRQSWEITTLAADNNVMRTIAVHCLHGMGNLYFQRRCMDDAVHCLEAALEICEQDEAHHQQTEQLQTAHVLNCLGVLQFHQCRPCNVDATVALFRRALAIQRKVLGNSRPDAATATTLNNLGRALCVGGRMDEALPAYLEAFDMRVRALGYDHLDVAATAYNIGQTLQQQKKLEQALEYYDHFMFIASRKLGRLHIDVVLTLKCMAQIHQEYRRFDKSLAIYHVALKAAKESVGRHAEVASILNKIGNIYFEMSDFDRAKEAYETGLQVERNHLDKHHPNIGVTLSNLGLILHRKGNLVAAKKMYQEALQVQQKCYGESDVRVAKTLFSIGNIELSMRDYAMALESYQQSLRVRRQNGTGDDLDVATTLNSVGLALYKMGIHALALCTFSECLRIRRNLLGPMARDVAVPLYNMGTIHHARGSDDQALHFFQQVHDIELGCKDKDVGYTLRTLAQLYEARGDNEMALSCYKEILQNLNEDDVEDEPAIVRTLTSIANMHLRCGETEQVFESTCAAIRVRQRHGKEFKDIGLSGFFLFDISKICTKAPPAA